MTKAELEQKALGLNTRLQGCLMVIAVYNAAAHKFLAKVNAGQANSLETYADMRHALSLAYEVLGLEAQK